MVTCTFLGHGELYDLDLYPGILSAIKKVVEQDAEIEFIFDKHSSFQFLCMAAILELRQRNPGKRLKTTFISDRNIDEQWKEYITAYYGLFPS